MNAKQIIAAAFLAEFCDTLDGDHFASEVIAALTDAGYIIVRSEPTYEACRAAGFSWEGPPFPPRYRALIAKLSD